MNKVYVFCSYFLDTDPICLGTPEMFTCGLQTVWKSYKLYSNISFPAICTHSQMQMLYPNNVYTACTHCVEHELYQWNSGPRLCSTFNQWPVLCESLFPDQTTAGPRNWACSSSCSTEHSCFLPQEPQYLTIRQRSPCHFPKPALLDGRCYPSEKFDRNNFLRNFRQKSSPDRDEADIHGNGG